MDTRNEQHYGEPPQVILPMGWGNYEVAFDYMTRWLSEKAGLDHDETKELVLTMATLYSAAIGDEAAIEVLEAPQKEALERLKAANDRCRNQ